MIGTTALPARQTRYLLDNRRLTEPSRLKLFCFHHAGGASSVFDGWQRELAADVSVLPVQLPGREYRVHEKRILSMDALVDELDHQLGPALDEPYAFYGHSMGATIAYAFARRRHELGKSLPQVLLLGACPPPLARTLPDQRLDSADLAAWMIELGGVPEALQRYPEWLDAATALLRDDLTLAGSYQHVEGEPLSCPIHVLAGRDDPLMSLEQAAGWQRHTAVGCSVHPMPGGHFFLREHPEPLLARLSSLLMQQAVRV